jgi:opacity protein-like surface antigen
MKNILVCLLTFVVIGSGVSTSLADTYVSGSLGAVIVEDSDVDEGVLNGQFTFDPGFGLLLAVGSTIKSTDRLSAQNGGRVAAQSNGRVEVELGYRRNDIDKIKINGFGSGNADGHFSSLSLMGNLYYDFSTESSFIPYVGAGAGAANIEVDDDNSNSENDIVVAGQLIVGASIAASESLSIDMQYRYFTTDNPDFDGLDAEYRTHNLMVGLRQSF